MKTTMKTMLALFAAVLVVGFAFAAKATKSIWEGPLASGANDVDRQVIDLTAKSFKAGDKLTIYYTAAGIAAQEEAEARPVGPMRDMKKYGDIQLFKADGTTMITSFPQILAEGTKEYTFEEDVEGIQISFWNLTVTKVDLEAEEEEEPLSSQYFVNTDLATQEGWNKVTSGGFNDTNNGLIGEFIVNSGNNTVPSTVDETHLATEYCFGFECRWASNYSSFTQESFTDIPAGSYKLTFDVENVNENTQAANYENRFTVTVGDQVFTDQATEWMQGQSAWTSHAIEFSVLEDGKVTISFGYGTGSNNLPWQNTPALYVSHLALEYVGSAAAAAIEALQAEIEAAQALMANAAYEDGKAELQAAIAAAQEILEGTDAAEIYAAVETLKAAEQAFSNAQELAENTAAVEDADVTAPVATDFVENGDFDTNIAPWQTTTGAQNNKCANNQQGAFTGNFYENWNPAPFVGKMYQVIENIPNGVYKLTIAAFVNNFAGASEAAARSFKAEAAQTVQYVYANADKTYLTTGEPTAYEVYTQVTDNKVEVGLEQTEAIANWMGLDNVALSYYGADCTVEEAYNADHPVNPIDELLEEATALAADADAVAVGKLIEAIAVAEAGGTAEALTAAIAQFKADNADQEKDETAKVTLNGWKKFETNNTADLAPDWAAPAITTYDGRTTQPAEVYEGTVETTGQIIYQDITGLANGSYKVGFYGNAAFTEGRGFESNVQEGDLDVAYVFANEEKSFIPAHIASSISEYQLEEFNVEVTDGTIKLGLGKEKAGTNWHTMQIYRLTWFTTAKDAYAAAQTELAALLIEAKALAADENKTEGKEAFNAVIATAEEATTTKANWYNISEIEAIIADLKTAMDNFKKAQWFIDFAAGEYYIIDAESGLMMAAGHDWGTRGIINELGLDLTLTPNAETRTVTIDSKVNNGENKHYLGSNLYMDSDAFGWALEYQGFGFYITDGSKYISIDDSENLVLSDTPREWIIVSAEGVLEQRLEEMAAGTKDAPTDATFLLKNPNFNRNDQRVSFWQVSEDCTNRNLNGGNNVNNCAESYHSTFTISQVAEGAPRGTYGLVAQGFYRQDGETAEDAPVFFANNATAELPVKTGEENSMTDASESFTAGSYTIEPFKVFIDNNETLTVGVRGTANNQWVIFDNFRLLYYGADNTATGISEVNANVNANSKTIYNLRGQKVQNAQKGLYIINGKKVVK